MLTVIVKGPHNSGVWYHVFIDGIAQSAYKTMKEAIEDAVGWMAINSMIKSIVKVTLENGNHWTTTINCSYQEAQKYYFDQNAIGGFEQSDEKLYKVVSVELIEEKHE